MTTSSPVPIDDRHPAVELPRLRFGLAVGCGVALALWLDQMNRDQSQLWRAISKLDRGLAFDRRSLPAGDARRQAVIIREESET